MASVTFSKPPSPVREGTSTTIGAPSDRRSDFRSTRSTNSRHLSTSTIPTTKCERLHVHEKHGESSFQAKILHVIHAWSVQLFLMFLLILDVLVVFVEIFLLAEFPPCNIIERDAISCCASSSDVSLNTTVVDDHHLRFLSADAHELCSDPYHSVSFPASCDDHKRSWLHTLHVALFSISITILSSFLIELALLMYALGPLDFFSHLFYVFDLLVVVISFTLEIIYFTLKGNEALEAAGGLVVGFRLWRFVRIGHGLMTSAVEITSHQYHEMEEENKLLKAHLEEFKIRMPTPSESHLTERDEDEES